MRTSVRVHVPGLILSFASVWALGLELSFGADYPSTVLADGPIAYYRFSDTLVGVPAPIAHNSGSLGTSADGLYMNGAAPGAEAPRPPAFIGFEADNMALQLDGVNDFVGTLVSLLNDKPRFTLSGWIRRG